MTDHPPSRQEIDEPSDYLWDRTGVPDAEVVRLESLLGGLRQSGPMPVLPARRMVLVRRRLFEASFLGLTAAAVLCLVAGAAWFAVSEARAGWLVETVVGRTAIDGKAVETSGELRRGTWLETGDASQARLSIGDIGVVDVDPNTRLQLIQPGGREHRLALRQGTIHALIWAPPKAFVVDTPSAVATDLGCAYTLQVDDTGAGVVRVTSGWVGFAHHGREAFIPQEAVCLTRPGVGPGTPYYEDAPDGYAEALAVLDFKPETDPARPAAFERVLAASRPRDALTLWHLLSRGTETERRRVFDRLSALVPPPDGVTLDGILKHDRRATDRWWNALGLDDASWWRMWVREW